MLIKNQNLIEFINIIGTSEDLQKAIIRCNFL